MRKRLVSLFAVAAIVGSACSAAVTQAPATGSPGAPTPVVTAPPIPPDITTTSYKPEAVGNRGGTLIEGISGEPTSIWYQTFDTFANDVDAFSPSLWSLWSTTSDLKYYGQLAADVPTTVNNEVKLNGDKMDVTINLVPGAMWSDNTPINCDDVIYQWHWQLDPTQVGNVLGHDGYEDIASIDGAGTSTCVVHFNKIYEQYLSLWTPLFPAHYLKTVKVADANKKLYLNADPAAGVYSGPYIPAHWAAGAEIDYKPNAAFWSTIKKAQPNFDAVKLVLFSDFDGEIAAFAKGDIDIGLEFNHTNIAAIKAAGIDAASMDVVPGVTYEHQEWNLTSLTKKFGAAGAKAFLVAIHYALDKDAINTRVLGSTVTPSCSFTSTQTWFYANIPCYKTDAAKAAQVLADGGFTKGSDGILTINGAKADVIGCVRADRQYRIDTMSLVASQLQPLGIKLEVKTTTATNQFGGWTEVAADTPCNLTHGNFDVGEYADLATPDPVSIYFAYHSKFIPETSSDHSGQNYTGYNSPEMDAFLETIHSTVDLVKIRDVMAKIQAIYVDPTNGFPEIALYNWQVVELKSPKVHNVSNNGSATTQSWNLEDIWRDAP